MKTDQLIQAMAADTTRTRPVEALLPAAVLLTAALVAAGFFGAFGVRHDLGEAVMQLRVLVKQAFPLLLALGAFGAALRLARPGARVGLAALALAAVTVLLAVAVVAELLVLPATAWGRALRGSTLADCLLSIVLMSAPVLAGSLWALRRGASTRPALTGAAAGLMSGGVGAALFALHCVEDSPLFYGVWYVLAILGVAGLGALLGRWLLRW